MQRLGVLALCTLVALATVWMLARSREVTNERSGAAALAGPAGDLAPSASGAEARRRRDAAVADPRSAAGFGAHADAGHPATQAATSGPVLDAPRSDAQPSERSVAPGYEGQAPISPKDVAGWARPRAQREPTAAADLESANASPSSPNAQATDGHILSAEEIAKRVEKVLPDGSMAPDELARAREIERQRVLAQSVLAAGYIAPRKEEPNPDVIRQLPAVTLPPPVPHTLPPPERKPSMSGAAVGVAPR